MILCEVAMLGCAAVFGKLCCACTWTVSILGSISPRFSRLHGLQIAGVARVGMKQRPVEDIQFWII